MCCLGGVVLPNARLYVELEGCAYVLVCLYVKKDAGLTLADAKWEERSLLLCPLSARRGQKMSSREGSWWSESCGFHLARALRHQPFLCSCPGQRAPLCGAASRSSYSPGRNGTLVLALPKHYNCRVWGLSFFFPLCNFHFCALAGTKLDIIWFFWSSCNAYICYLHSDLHFQTLSM